VNPKPVVWIGTSYDDLRDFPGDVQDDLGYALYLAQIGELAEKAKPMHGSVASLRKIPTIRLLPLPTVWQTASRRRPVSGVPSRRRFRRSRLRSQRTPT
jgi:hypothetical protein